MAKYFSVLCFCLIGNSMFAQAPAISTMQANNVRATFKADGTLFSDGQQGQYMPMEPGLAQKTLMRHSGIWLAGLDPGGNLKGAVSVNNYSDFRPGGLMEEAPFVYDFNKIWKVSCFDVQHHLADYQDNGVIDNPNPAVYAFPCLGNPFFEQYNPSLVLPYAPQGLAGFRDKTGELLYDPSLGESPSIQIRGCATDIYPQEQNWFVFNDLTAHPSGLQALQMEIQTQFFAYKIPVHSQLNNAVFVRYKLINHASEKMEYCYFGIYADFDIGNPDDDFVGYIPGRQTLYGYNGDATDEGGFGTEVPVIAAKILRGPMDAWGDEMLVSHVMVMNHALNFQPHEYYNILCGKQRDGSPAPNNGMMYPGNPNDQSEVSEVSLGNIPGQRVAVASYGPFTLLPGAVNELIIAYFYMYEAGITSLQNIQSLYDQTSEIQHLYESYFDGFANNCDATTDAPYYVQKTGLLFSPNPADAAFTIESKGEPFSRIEVMDMLGRRVKSIEFKPTKQHAVQTEDLQSGVYQVRVGARVLPVVVQH